MPYTLEDSDTTLSFQDEEKARFLRCHCHCHYKDALSTPKSHNGLWQWFPLRLLIETLMVLTILVLASLVMPESRQSGFLQDLGRSGRVKVSAKSYVFERDERFVNEHVFTNNTALNDALRYWLPLSTRSRGMVSKPKVWPEQPSIPSDEDSSVYDIAAPYHGDPLKIGQEEDLYMVTVFHQLHCLSYLIQFYSAEKTPKIYSHMAHCFDYLRQGIMCLADTTLEGDTGQGEGLGVRHVCRDYEQVRDWAEERSPWQFDKEVGIDVVGNGHL